MSKLQAPGGVMVSMAINDWHLMAGVAMRHVVNFSLQLSHSAHEAAAALLYNNSVQCSKPQSQHNTATLNPLIAVACWSTSKVFIDIVKILIDTFHPFIYLVL